MPIEGVAVGPQGELYLAESTGRVVYVGNARTQEREARVLYAARERLNGLSIGPSGSLHAVGLHYHTNAAGEWRKEVVVRSTPHAELVGVWALADDDVFVGGKGEALRRAAGGWSPLPLNLRSNSTVHSIAGTSAVDVYFAGNEVVYFNGAAETVSMPTANLYLVVTMHENEAWIVGRDPAALYRGRGSVFTLAGSRERSLFGVATLGAEVFVATGQQLFAWEGDNSWRSELENRDYRIAGGYGVLAAAGYAPDATTGKLIAGLFARVADGVWSFFPNADKSQKPPPRKKSAAKK